MTAISLVQKRFFSKGWAPFSYIFVCIQIALKNATCIFMPYGYFTKSYSHLTGKKILYVFKVHFLLGDRKHLLLSKIAKVFKSIMKSFHKSKHAVNIHSSIKIKWAMLIQGAADYLAWYPLILPSFRPASGVFIYLSITSSFSFCFGKLNHLTCFGLQIN